MQSLPSQTKATIALHFNAQYLALLKSCPFCVDNKILSFYLILPTGMIVEITGSVLLSTREQMKFWACVTTCSLQQLLTGYPTSYPVRQLEVDLLRGVCLLLSPGRVRSWPTRMLYSSMMVLRKN